MSKDKKVKTKIPHLNKKEFDTLFPNTVSTTELLKITVRIPNIEYRR